MIPSSARADVSIGGFILDVLYFDGTTAEAVQSMLAAILQSRYQNYVFSKGESETERFSNFSTRRADFVAVQVSRGQGRPANRAAGATKSYLLIMSMVLVHNTIVCSIVAWYLKATTATLFGESWSNIAQIITPTTIGYLEKASFAKDPEVEASMQNNNSHSILIKVGTSTTGRESREGLIRQRTYTSLPRHDESEQNIMMNRLRLRSSSTIELAAQVGVSTEPTTLTVAESNVPPVDSDEDPPSPVVSDMEDTSRQERLQSKKTSVRLMMSSLD